ncbi:pilus assembly FimT family protein [Candidatus Electrothrix sp.]|uniref:pilus assembly FimT family protein n=1 Tax=Candidatus Electrothrix sp. TaxID=2170559 RepID=UPI004056608E
MTKQQGFTLLELIVVMVLISLTAVFTMPKIQASLYSNELSATAQRIVSLVTATAQEARARHTSYTLRFDPDTKEFVTVPVTRIPEMEEEEQNKAFLRVTLDDSVRLAGIETPENETLTANTTVHNNETGILFTSKGYTRKAAIHLENDTGDQRTVILSPFLGLARILDGYVTLENDRIIVSR